MRVYVRNGYVFEVIAVNHAYSDGLNLYIQDVIGDWYCVSGFANHHIICHYLNQLCTNGFCDLSDYDSVIYERDFDEDVSGGDA